MSRRLSNLASIGILTSSDLSTNILSPFTKTPVAVSKTPIAICMISAVLEYSEEPGIVPVLAAVSVSTTRVYFSGILASATSFVS